MAFPTSINDQITDAVSQSTVNNFGLAAASASATAQQAAAQSLALRMAGTVGAMARADILRQAVTGACVGATLDQMDHMIPDDIGATL